MPPSHHDFTWEPCMHASPMTLLENYMHVSIPWLYLRALYTYLPPPWVYLRALYACLSHDFTWEPCIHASPPWHHLRALYTCLPLNTSLLESPVLITCISHQLLRESCTNEGRTITCNQPLIYHSIRIIPIKLVNCWLLLSLPWSISLACTAHCPSLTN